MGAVSLHHIPIQHPPYCHDDRQGSESKGAAFEPHGFLAIARASPHAISA